MLRALRRELELLPEMFQYMKQQMLQNAPKLLPGAISEHSGAFCVPCIGTFLGAIPIPGAFLKAIPGKIFAFPMTTVCVWISATQAM